MFVFLTFAYNDIVSVTYTDIDHFFPLFITAFVYSQVCLCGVVGGGGG